MKRQWNFLAASFFLLSLIFPSAGANTSSASWQHPGVLVSQQQLDFIKQQVNAHVQPYYGQFLKAQASPIGSLSYTPKGPYPGGVNQCGSYSNPDQGCSDADSDGAAAYIQAVLWYITGNQKYATNAINIMNTWVSSFKGFAGYTTGYPCPAGTDCSNGPLQAGWDSEKWPRAAEIIRYANGGSAGWAATDITAFSNMLKNIYEPIIYNGKDGNGNWELSMIDGMMGIAVFNEDLPLLQHAQTFWQQRVPAYFYNFTIDNPLYPGTHAPFPPGRTGGTWNGQLIFDTNTTGVAQETCRDLGHTEYGIAAAINAAETDYIQSGFTANLYTANGAQERMITSLNLMAGLELAKSTTAPTDFCTDAGNIINLGPGVTYVIAYNEYHNRLNDPQMADASGTTGLNGTSNTYQWIQNDFLLLSAPYDHHMEVFEGLTHYGNAPTPVDTGTLQLAASSTSDANCANAVDTLTLDSGAISSSFTVSNGLTQTLSTGSHSLSLKSSGTAIPAGGSLSGTCSGTLSTSAVTVTANQTTAITATYQYKAASGGTCTFVSQPVVTSVTTWGADVFQLEVKLSGFPVESGNIAVNGSMVMKNSFKQFWNNVGLTSTWTGSTGTLSGKFYTGSTSGSFTVDGYLNDGSPVALKVGDNPLQSMTVNGVTCS